MPLRHENIVSIEFDPLRRRCIRLAKSGLYRKAAIAMAELAHRENDAASWVRLGVMLQRAGRVDPALDALKQALWLLQQGHERRRAAVVAGLIERAAQLRVS